MSAPATPASATKAVEAKQEEEVVAAGVGASRLKKMLMIAILLAGLACLAYWWFNGREKMKGSNGGTAEDQPATIMGALSSMVGGILGFNRSGDPVMDRRAAPAQLAAGPVHNESKSAMAEIAASAKAAGLRLQGVSQCKWTQHQREMFGDRDDAARKEIESIYTECRSREMCPNIKGYPTWLHGDRQYPGFKSPSALKALIREVESQQAIPSLQGASEPVEENIPAAVPVLGSAETPDPTMMYEMMKRMLSKKEADAVAEMESNKEQDHANATGGGAQKGEPGGSAPGVKCDEKAPTKENVRGVSFHPPLNVPDMPGTAPFVLNTSFSDDQTRQGNAPRVAADSHKATAELAEQVVNTFNQAMTHEATRSATAHVYSQAKLPHSVDITTGDGFDDKTLEVAKN